MKNKDVNATEINKFNSLANEWWNPNGKMRVLHKFNKPRIEYILKKISEHFPNKPNGEIKILDVGCGGGLLSEALALQGFQVTGVDPSDKLIKIAKSHALLNGVNNIEYINALVQDLRDSFTNQYDIVISLEVIEHVDNVDDFLATCASFVKKDGLLVLATINRNIKSLIFAKFAAEYVLRWLPVGTHRYSKFITVSEVNKILEANSLSLVDVCGISFSLLNASWKTSNDVSMNYILTSKKTK